MNMTKYLNEFERLHSKIKAHGMTLSDGVLAYRVLSSANLSKDQEQLARATICDLKYEDMVRQLKKIFGDSTTNSEQASAPIKVEAVFEAEEHEETHEAYYGAYKGRGTRSRRSRGFRGNRTSRGTRRLNPADEKGRHSKCNICESIFHWARNCPNAYENQEPQSGSNNRERKSEEISLYQSPDPALAK